jgi:hypothetical protein
MKVSASQSSARHLSDDEQWPACASSGHPDGCTEMENLVSAEEATAATRASLN